MTYAAAPLGGSTRANTAALLGFVTWLWLASPAATMACQADWPTFTQAIGRAEAVARVRTIGVPVDGSSDRTVVLRVEKVLKGSLPDTVRLAKPYAHLCHDSVAFWAGLGSVAIVAFGVPFHGDTLYPVWVEYDQGIDSSAGVPHGVRTLRELEQAILAIPDTATADGRTSAVGDGADLRLIVVFVVALVMGLRRLQRSFMPVARTGGRLTM